MFLASAVAYAWPICFENTNPYRGIELLRRTKRVDSGFSPYCRFELNKGDEVICGKTVMGSPIPDAEIASMGGFDRSGSVLDCVDHGPNSTIEKRMAFRATSHEKRNTARLRCFVRHYFVQQPNRT